MAFRASLGIGWKQRSKEKHRESQGRWEVWIIQMQKHFSGASRCGNLLARKLGALWSLLEPGVSQLHYLLAT